MKKIIDRLNDYIVFKGISLHAFDKSIGTSNGYIGKQIKNRASIGGDMLEKISCVYADLNMDWLITGEGEMLRNINKDGLPPIAEKTSGDPPVCERCKDKDAVIAAQRAQIESQTELLDLLKQARPLNDGQKRKTA